MRLTKNDSRDLGFVQWCLASEAITTEEFRQWVLHVVEVVDSPPPYIFDLIDFDGLLGDLGDIIPFTPAWDPTNQQIAAISGIALTRGVSPFEPVDEQTCLRALAECPSLNEWFAEMFPLSIEPQNKTRMTKPLPLWSRNFEASSNIYPEVEGALSAAAGIALTLCQEMTPRTKTVVRGIAIAFAAFAAGVLFQFVRGTHREEHSLQSFAFQDYDLELRYFTEWQGIRFLHTNSSSLELINRDAPITIFEVQRGFQESHRELHGLETDGDTISWDDGVDGYRLTITPLSTDK